MRWLSLVVLLSVTAQAADDAPVKAADVSDLRCLDAQERANIVKAYEFQKARADALEKEAPPTKALVIGLIVGALVIGAGAGVGVGYAAAKAK